MLNSVQLYMKGLLDGLVLPIPEAGTLTAVIAPPDVADPTDPMVYVWGATVNERRKASPRAKPGNPSSGGFKEILYKMDLWLFFPEAADDPLADSLFPVVIDAVAAVLRNTQIGVILTDPQTGAQSTVLVVGEDIAIDYAPARASADQRYLIYMARLIVDLKESIQA